MSASPASDETRTFQLLQQVKTAALTPEQEAELKHAEKDGEGKDAPILVADDSDDLRTVMVLTLHNLGYWNISEAVNGREALEKLRQRPFELMILDIEMPVLDGFDVLREMKADPKLRDLSVIVASGLHDLNAVVRCIQLGAEDFLPKPVNAILLRARLKASLERTRLRARERLHLLELRCEKRMLQVEQEKSARLLLNILPAAIADRLKHGERTIADHFASVTVLFADIVGFTAMVNQIDPKELVTLLSELFSRFDRLANRHRVEKIKTIGDSYLAVGGLPDGAETHVEAIANMAWDMLGEVTNLSRESGRELRVRIGMNTGPVVAGVIGHNKFAYDLWGATVNLASRMQSTGLPGRIHLPAATGELLRHRFRVTAAETVECKGIGEVATCFLEGPIA